MLQGSGEDVLHLVLEECFAVLSNADAMTTGAVGFSDQGHIACLYNACEAPEPSVLLQGWEACCRDLVKTCCTWCWSAWLQ